MTTNHQTIEDLLHVGGQTFLDVTNERGQTRRAKTKVRGWVPGEYILMDLPAAPDEASCILKDAVCVVRFVHEGAACGFNTKIMDWCDMGLPFFRIGWPADVKVLHVRKHARVPVHLPCTFSFPDGQDSGVVSDLSNGGCGLIAKRFLKDGTPLRLSFTLPDGTPIKSIRSTVRRSRPHGNEVIIGCSFMAGAEGQNDALIFYLTSTLHRMGVQPLAARRVMLVYPEGRECGGLVHAFERAGVESIIAHNPVDAFYRLRMAPPECLLLDVEQAVVAVTDLCAAIRQTPGFETMPIFLVGDSKGENDLMSACQARDWFKKDRMQKEPDAVVSACLQSVEAAHA